MTGDRNSFLSLHLGSTPDSMSPPSGGVEGGFGLLLRTIIRYTCFISPCQLTDNAKGT